MFGPQAALPRPAQARFGRLLFLHLDGSYALIAERLERREGHFMPASLLRSQFDALERLEEDERGAAVPIDGARERTATEARAALERAGLGV